MSKRVLITGGAGFLGSHLADELLRRGYAVRILDNLTPRVHPGGVAPSYLDPAVDLMVGDVRDGDAVERALRGVDVVYHFAGAVGAGESVFEIDRCMSANNVGTAVLMDRLVRTQVERLVLGSTMCVYGEGLYADAYGTLVEVRNREPERLEQGLFDVEQDGEALTPVATPETKSTCASGSVYATSKRDQERMCLRYGKAFGIPTTALRFFNVYGARQSSCNPYTSDLQRVALDVMSGRRPVVPEDGRALRDYVHVSDAVSACVAAMSLSRDYDVVNVGSGRPTSLLTLARKIAEITRSPKLLPEPSGRHELHAVRHCFADIARAKHTLGFECKTRLDEGLTRWLATLRHQPGRSRRRTVRIDSTPSLELAS